VGPSTREIREALAGRTILIVPYSHSDWAWTHSRRWHEVRYTLVVDEVLDILAAQDEAGVAPDAPEAYRWYTDCWRTQIATFLETRPERYEELRRRIAEGRIAVCGGYANLRINHVPGELFVRGMVLGRRQWRQVFPEADLTVHSDIVDVAVGYPQLPQLLRLAGYDYLQFWRPEEALNAKGVPHHFVWEGIDGSRVLAARGCYGGLTVPHFAPDDYPARWEETVGYWWENVLRYKRRHAPTPVLWQNRGADDARPLKTHFVSDIPIDLPGLIAEWNRRETSTMRFATPVEAFAALEARRDELPVVSGTLDPIDVAYNAAWGGSQGLWKLREGCAREIGIAEMLHALVGNGNGKRHRQQDSGPSGRTGWRLRRQQDAATAETVNGNGVQAVAPGLQGKGEAVAPGLQGKGEAVAPGLQGKGEAVAPGLQGKGEAVAPGLQGKGEAAAPGLRGPWVAAEGDGDDNDRAAWERRPSGRQGPGQRAFDELWRDTLLFSAHAIQWLFQEDFDELYELAQSTFTRARRAQQDALAALAAQVDCGDEALQVLANSLPHEREATVPLRVTFVRGESQVPKPLRLVDGDGREAPHQVLRELRHANRPWELDALARITLPAGGWTVLRAEKAEPAEDPAPEIEDAQAIDNGLVALHFDRGRLMRIAEDSGAEWDAPEDTPFGHLRACDVDTTKPLHVGPIVGSTDAVWERWRVTEAGPVRWSFRSEGAIGACPAVLEARLHAGERRVEFAVEVEWDGRGGHLASHLPFPGRGAITGDMPFCVEDKPLWDEPYVGIERTREGMFIARSFVDWTADGRGLAYVSHDGDRYFILDREANVLAHILINSVREPYAEWEESVNRQMRGEGRHRFTFSLVPHEPGAIDLWRLSENLRTRVLQTRPLGAGELPMAGSLLAVSPRGVSLSACHADGDRLLLRVFERSGGPARAEIALPFEVAEAAVVDLNGEPMDGPVVEVDGRTVAVKLRPWQIATVAVKR